MDFPAFSAKKLVLEHVALQRGYETILRGVDLALPAGSCHLFVGPNGIGKTTLLRAICGLLPLSEGRIIFDEYTPLAQASHYLAHEDALKDALSVEEQLGYWGGMLDAAHHCHPEAKPKDLPQLELNRREILRSAQDDKIIQTIALTDFRNTPTVHLSAGQRKRLALGRLLAAARPIWCLDEPTNTLDAQGITLLNTLIQTHTQNGGIALVSTHSPQLIPLGTAISLDNFVKNLNSGLFSDMNNLF